MMRIPIAIPVFYKNEDTDIQDQFEKLGIETKVIPLEEYDIRNITFYNIDAVSTYRNDGDKYGLIHSAAQDFISPWSEDKINQTIINHISKINQ